jgi:hypothetical protein
MDPADSSGLKRRVCLEDQMNGLATNNKKKNIRHIYG